MRSDAQSGSSRLTFWAARRTALIFALVSLAWIILSDVFLEWMVKDRNMLHWLETVGGVLFVVLVGVLLYVVLRRDVVQLRRSEEALRERTAQYRELVESMNDGLAVKDENGRVAFVNDKFCAMVGCAREELLGRPIAEFIDPECREAFDQENVNRRKGEEAPYEIKLLDRTGRKTPVIVSPRPLFDAQGGFRGSLAVFTDISKRLAAEEELRLTKVSVDRASVAIYWLNPEGKVLYANETACRSLGYTLEELLTLSVLDFDHCCTPQSWATHWQRLKQDGQRIRERQHRTKDGRVFPVEIAGNYLKIGDKEYDFVFVRDLTERRQAEEALRLAKVSVDRASVAIYWLSPEGRLLYANETACRWLGYTPEELPTLSVLDFDPDCTLETWARFWQKLKQRGAITFDWRHRAKSGRVFPVEIAANYLKVGDEEYEFAFVRDLTERRQAEETLREHEETLRLLFEHANDGINVAEFDPKTARRRLITCNQRYVEMSGRTLEELMATGNLDEFVEYPATREEKRLWYEKTLAGTPYHGTASWKRPDGKENYYEWAAAPVTKGDKVYIYGVDRDVTERRRAEEVLREREETLRLLSEHASDGINIAEYDPETHKRRLVSCNRRYVEMTGRTLDELLAAEDLNDFVEYSCTGEERREWRRKAREGVPYHGTASWKRPDGKENWYEWTAAPMRKGDKIYIFGIDRDVTERKQAENQKGQLARQVLQAQKLEALGTLAGGVAHDFNNLLTGILGYASLLKVDAPPDSEVSQAAEAIESAARRAAQLTGQLLAFARKGKRENVAVDMHQTISELKSLLERAVGERVTLRTGLQAPSCLVRGDPGRLEQVIFNLAVNARDAMPEGGELSIDTAVAEVAEGAGHAPADLGPGRYFAFSVTDTGCGIPEEIRDRVFEPFFTTKDPGKATGLGLALVYGVVKDHGGAVQLQSEVGRGSTFKVYLPLAEGEGAVPRRETLPAKLVRGTGRILVVDDDQVVRETACRLLRELGYEVIALSDARLALEHFRRSAKDVDLVIVDMVMAGMSGLECFRAFKEIRPDVRVLLSTGYGPEGRADQLLAEGLSGVIQKPYGVQQLSEAVARTLSQVK